MKWKKKEFEGMTEIGREAYCEIDGGRTGNRWDVSGEMLC
jgi:hypothetical protein